MFYITVSINQLITTSEYLQQFLEEMIIVRVGHK